MGEEMATQPIRVDFSRLGEGHGVQVWVLLWSSGQAESLTAITWPLLRNHGKANATGQWQQETVMKETILLTSHDRLRRSSSENRAVGAQASQGVKKTMLHESSLAISFFHFALQTYETNFHACYKNTKVSSLRRGTRVICSTCGYGSRCTSFHPCTLTLRATTETQVITSGAPKILLRKPALVQKAL
ncbi:hypothetical protein SRHO_G00072880 [Serrasalmus rhombeus]